MILRHRKVRGSTVGAELDYVSSLFAPGQVRPDVDQAKDFIWDAYMASVQARLETYVTMWSVIWILVNNSLVSSFKRDNQSVTIGTMLCTSDFRLEAKHALTDAEQAELEKVKQICRDPIDHYTKQRTSFGKDMKNLQTCSLVPSNNFARDRKHNRDFPATLLMVPHLHVHKKRH
jgi:hypothetical protein